MYVFIGAGAKLLHILVFKREKRLSKKFNRAKKLGCSPPVNLFTFRSRTVYLIEALFTLQS